MAGLKPKLNLATYSVKRYAASTIDDAGDRSDGAVTAVTITANTQPIVGQALKLLQDEGQKISSAYLVLTKDVLYIADQPTNKKADKVTIAGVDHEVHKFEAWPGHYEATVIKVA